MRTLIGTLDWLFWRIWYGQFRYQLREGKWRRSLRQKPQQAEPASGSLTAAQSGSGP